MFGSVAGNDVVDALKLENINIDEKQIVLDEPIKKLGVYHISIKLHPDVTASVKAWIVKE